MHQIPRQCESWKELFKTSKCLNKQHLKMWYDAYYYYSRENSLLVNCWGNFLPVNTEGKIYPCQTAWGVKLKLSAWISQSDLHTSLKPPKYQGKCFEIHKLIYVLFFFLAFGGMFFGIFETFLWCSFANTSTRVREGNMKLSSISYIILQFFRFATLEMTNETYKIVVLANF